MRRKKIVLDGMKFSDIESFYSEIYGMISKDIDWVPAHNLDALHDILYGGFGIYRGDERIILVWKNVEKSKIDLGFDETKRYYERRISEQNSNVKHWKLKFEELIFESGQTLFEIIKEIILQHERIELRLA